MHVSVIAADVARDLIASWATQRVGRYVCVANVHMCMETFDSAAFRKTVNSADLVVPDGLPLVWTQRLMGHRCATQVRGEDLMHQLCKKAVTDGLKVGFFGSTPEILSDLRAALLTRYPMLEIACMIAPPFRTLDASDNLAFAEAINRSGTQLLFVGLGCPKQESWMAMQRDSIAAVAIGVGAAFEFVGRGRTAAPRWMRRSGLEWLFRLLREPRRLWRRYFYHNPRFIWHVSKEVLLSRVVKFHR